ncbi:hypothetical protein SK128_012184 [Halocaridina rubra]|uniref:Uncharacterized protein n=1 Tax=Halocaridina rubra TaxID=373956 RepID=A0AAN8WIC6_HALRR
MPEILSSSQEVVLLVEKRSSSNNESQYLDQSQQMRRQEFRQKLEARARLRRENHGVSSLYSSHNSGNHNYSRNFTRSNVHVQTENYYEPVSIQK